VNVKTRRRKRFGTLRSNSSRSVRCYSLVFDFMAERGKGIGAAIPIPQLQHADQGCRIGHQIRTGLQKQEPNSIRTRNKDYQK